MALGFGRTLDGALGRLAVRLAALALLPLLAGCAVASDVAAVGAAAVAGSATGNPAVGLAVGIGVRAGVEELRRYVVRRRQAGEQDAIASVAGAAPLNEPRLWEIRHTVPIGNQRGELAVVREFATPLATCREVVFSVVDDTRELFATTLCREGDRWAWAAAEPAVERWGFLQ